MAIKLPNFIKYKYVMMLPAGADFTSTSIGAVYHRSNFDSAAAAYRIGIYTKNWVRQCVVYHGFGCVGPVVPWFAVRIIMVAMFFWGLRFICYARGLVL